MKLHRNQGQFQDGVGKVQQTLSPRAGNEWKSPEPVRREMETVACQWLYDDNTFI